MVMVTRLTRQKGLDLVMYALDRILSGGVQVAVLGTGDRDYEDGLRYFQDKYPAPWPHASSLTQRCRSACTPPPTCS